MNADFFTFENLKGEYLSLKECIRLGTPTAVFGVSDAHKYMIASLPRGKVFYLVADGMAAERAVAAISAVSGRKCVRIAAKDDVVTCKTALSKDALFKRLFAVSEMQDDAEIIVCDVQAAMQLFPLKQRCITLEKGEEYNYQTLPETLVKMGYTREYSVDAAGSFAVRGDILDIWCVGYDNPLRVDFFGDTVEKIRRYDYVSGERLEESEKVKIVAATDVCVEDCDIPAVKAALYSNLASFGGEAQRRARAICEELSEKISNRTPFAGETFLMPLLSGSATLFDILPKDITIVFDECKQLQDSVQALYKEHTERVAELKKGGEAFDFSIRQMLSPESFISGFSAFRTFAVQTFATTTSFYNPLKTFSLHATPSPSYLNGFAQLVTDIKNWLSNGYRVLIFTGNIQRAQKLENLFAEAYVPLNPLPYSLNALRGASISAADFSHGFILHENKLVILGSGDLYVKAAVKMVRRKRGDMFAAPEIGDYCVHETHGIGKIVGTEKIETGDGIKEYVSVEYRGGEMLYVPVEQMDVLSKYVGDASPSLSKIGGADFEKVKDRVKKSIRELAFDLKKLYAERSERRGFRFPPHEALMEEFERSFAYEETPDQLTSIEEIKSDMCSDKVMDRLLCGDVGYGKTEVALRAIYLCVLGGKQAALMCPGTVLSEQHYNTAVERFADFGVRVDKLNRFKTPAQQAETIKKLANGEIDLIIGTHRLLSQDVAFYDLGLLVLDEEQRFGVEHKEKIKNLKTDVDCLTMTATPIPRTLHMSLSGIRDISTINTPPLKRLPVQTYVAEETETLIRDACLRELSRGGQVFILYNRVETISSFASKISAIVPEGKVCYAHGRMDRDVLENNVFAFYRGEKNILVTTTIIENGIDLPNANTIIVIDADRLGISQLYQLRGRVGRSSRLAQAYFTFKPEKILTSEATERLKAIMQFTELGSGFKIAMRDLEIRGAGNVLGAEQHGHLDKVGYELYSKLLKEELTGEASYSAELDVKTSAYIPERYIESPAGRMDSYKQIAEIRSAEDYKRVYTSLEDSFGPIPDEVFNLLIIAVLKAYASKFNVRKICVDGEEGSLELPSVNSLNDKRLDGALRRYGSQVGISMAKAPLLVFKPERTPTHTMLKMTKFLKFALTFA